MEWVENGHAPDMIVAERRDPTTGTLLSTRPNYPYPKRATYIGSGDRDDAANYTSTMSSPTHAQYP